ncbi:MAG: FAD-binding oxidoreductase [Chloroflexota bacterium]|nr:FAD-binding oxidoreductase [Chloroflexota bacterium]
MDGWEPGGTGSAAARSVAPPIPPEALETRAGVVVNDVHSGLNPTRVLRVERPRSATDLGAAVGAARRDGRPVSIAGGRHAMGGQQFGDGTVLIDTRGMDRVLAFDEEAGEIEVEAGIQWPALVDWLVAAQQGRARQWGIVQKQTGADRLSLGGAVSANIHGRGLALKPFVADVAALTLVDAQGELVRCSRDENAELFRLAAGGYGLFGAIATVRLRLAPRRKMERVVEVRSVDGLVDAFERRKADGFLYGDFQFAIDPAGDDFLNEGVFSCYRPVDPETPVPPAQRALSREDWRLLLELAHVDKRRAVDAYTAHYLATSGQIYWSDLHQMADYVDGYHAAIDAQNGGGPASEMIGELYVPRPALAGFLAQARDDFRAHGVDVIYGTVRLIERDDESVLAWAREPWACVVVNLHTPHTEAGVAATAAAFRRLIDLALGHGGSYYLTYHRWATRAQIEAAHPRFAEFLRLKRRYDPEERFQSDWYRHHRAMFADTLGAQEPGGANGRFVAGSAA